MPDFDESGDLYLTDVSPDDKPWDIHRAMASEIEGYYWETSHHRLAERMLQCATLLEFALRPADDGSIKLKLKHCHFCRVRHCPICQWRRRLMWLARFFRAIPEIVGDYSTHRWLFLTLTVRNCPLSELRATLGHMNKSWERMSKRKKFPATGWVRTTEVTRAADNQAHPHFHCLLMVPASYFSHGYIKQAEWTELWKQALRADYDPIVNVKAVRGKKGDSEDDLVPIRAVLETIKYSVKPSDFLADGNRAENVAWLDGITRELHKTRAISVGGVLRQYLSEEDPEDLIHAEDEEIELSESDLSVWFGWREMVKRYRKVERDDGH
jgi:plasmid rolling circle replication initiator protein Rep